MIVSPHRRTIQTAVNLLKSHPQRENLTLKLVPVIKEQLFSAACVPVPLDELKEFVRAVEKESGLKIECDIESETWGLDVMTSEEFITKMRQTLEDPKKNLVDGFLEHKRVETYQEMFDRSGEIESFLIS